MTETTSTTVTSEQPALQGLVILMSGTPITNGTAEDLISQLSILGRLERVAQAPGRQAVKAFRRRFMRWEETGHGYGKYTGVRNAPELLDRLRSDCYIRREKSQVLSDLPPLLRGVTPLALNGALDEYRKAEDDMRAYIGERGGSAALSRYERAEAIVRLNNLMRLAGEAKAVAAIDWVNQFRTERPGASLVIFAKHLPVQKALVAALEATGEGCVHFGGGLTEAQVADRTDAFQEGRARFAVASIAAAGVGITLTKADTVLMVEQDWTPKDADQAEARIHRPGQTSDKAEAIYLLASDTVDDYLFDLVDAKREVFRAACIGEATEADLDSLNTGGMQAEVLSTYFA